MAKQMRLVLAAATLSAVSAVCAAQTAGQSGPANLNSTQTEAAPIEHAHVANNNHPAGERPLTQVTIAPNEEVAPGGGEAQANPTPGVILRVGMQSAVREVTSDAEKLELRVERGVANVNVHDPAKGKLILVDLPGGQTQLLKNGLYTFNAETNTARVLKGEALAFPQDAAPDAKPRKVKEYNKVVFNGTDVKPHEFVPYEASVDLLPGPEGPRADGMAPGYGYGAYPYGDGFYGVPGLWLSRVGLSVLPVWLWVLSVRGRAGVYVLRRIPRLSRRLSRGISRWRLPWQWSSRAISAL
jgi:hypothetical protein